MARPVTLFTGQWADLSLETLAEKASSWGYDGLELACWGDHFDVQRALKEPEYCQGRHDLLKRYGLNVYAISNHLVGQAVCDHVDQRHRAILPAHVWGDGNPKNVQHRAALEMQDTARAAAKLGVKVVNGFTGSSIWPLLYSFPPNDPGMIEAGFQDFADRWNPILDIFDEVGVRLLLKFIQLKSPLILPVAPVLWKRLVIDKPLDSTMMQAIWDIRGSIMWPSLINSPIEFFMLT